MKISKGPKIKCKKCQKIYSLNPEDFDEPEVYSDERNMGYEIGYEWNYTFNCDNCNSEISIIVEGYEYPEGAFNYENFETRGCIILENPTLEIVSVNDYFDEEYD